MKKFLTIFIVATVSACASAQSSVLADILQDLELIKREVGKLSLEIERLSSENESLKKALKDAQNAATSNEGMNAATASLRAEINSSVAKSQSETLAIVRKELDSLASQTNANLEKLAKAIGAKPQGQVQTNVSENYPKMGVTHTVERGDTLSKIARKYGSTVKWIQDANRIADANRGLVIGQTIFVPTKE